MTGLQVRGLGDRDPPVLAADTPSQLTPILWHLVHFNVPLFYVSRCVFEALSWDKGFCCVSSIKRHFFLSSPPLEILLGQAVPAQDLFIAGFVLPLPCAHTPPPALPARGVFPPQPMKSGWQHLPRCCNPGHHLPWQPWEQQLHFGAVSQYLSQGTPALEHPQHFWSRGLVRRWGDGSSSWGY